MSEHSFVAACLDSEGICFFFFCGRNLHAWTVKEFVSAEETAA